MNQAQTISSLKIVRIVWIVSFFFPSALFLFLILTGYMNTPESETPAFIGLMGPKTVIGIAVAGCWVAVLFAKVSWKRKLLWLIFSALAIVLQCALLLVFLAFAYLPRC